MAGCAHIAWFIIPRTFNCSLCPTTRKGTAKVRAGKGVKINHIYYWSEAFRSPNLERKNVEVRYDPWNAGIAYAYVGGRWVECKSQYWGILRGRSERELMLATRELRRRQCLHTQEVFTVLPGDWPNFSNRLKLKRSYWSSDSVTKRRAASWLS